MNVWVKAAIIALWAMTAIGMVIVDYLNKGGKKMASYGDIIRDMDDEELAEFLVNTIAINGENSAVYKVSVHDKVMVVLDEEDLAERLAEECDESETVEGEWEE